MNGKRSCGVQNIMECYSSIKKEWIWVSWTEVNETRACYTEQSMSEREKQISCINAHMHTHTCVCICICICICVYIYMYIYMSHLGSSVVKNLPVIQELEEMHVWSLGQEDPWEKDMATRSGILAWRIPWTEEPGELYIVHRVTKSWTQLKW